MNIEYLENRRNLPSDGVMFLAMKQDRHQNGMPTVCVDTCGNIWSQQFALFPRNILGTHWKLKFYQLFSPMERPKAKEKCENGKETHWKDGNCNLSGIWQKPPKAKENWENCRENKPCAICYVVACSNSAGNLSDGRKKLGWVPLAQWNHKNEAFLQCKAWKWQLVQQFSRIERPKARKN